MTPDLEIRSETLPISALTHAVHEERYDPLLKDDPLFVLDQPEERKGLATLVKGEDKVACQREKTPEQMSVSFSEKETTKNIYIAYGTAIFPCPHLCSNWALPGSNFEGMRQGRCPQPHRCVQRRRGTTRRRR